MHSANPKDHDTHYSHKIICKDAALSMATIGMPFQALIVNVDKTPTLQPDGLDYVLAFLANFLNLDEVQVGDGGKRTRRGLMNRAETLRPRVEKAVETIGN